MLKAPSAPGADLGVRAQELVLIFGAAGLSAEDALFMETACTLTAALYNTIYDVAKHCTIKTTV